eukprot:2195924-Rhodomonas_salina.5
MARRRSVTCDAQVGCYTLLRATHVRCDVRTDIGVQVEGGRSGAEESEEAAGQGGGEVSAYADATRCPVDGGEYGCGAGGMEVSAMVLRMCYALSGTDVEYGATRENASRLRRKRLLGSKALRRYLPTPRLGGARC